MTILKIQKAHADTHYYELHGTFRTNTRKVVQKLGSKEGFPFLSLGVFIFFSPCSTVTKHAEKLKVHFLPH